MGGKSSSSSSSTSTTEQYDQRVAVEAGGIGIGAGATVHTTSIDPELVSAAASVLENGLEQAANVIESVTDSTEQTTKNVLGILSEQVESDAKEVTELALKIMAGVVVVIGFIIFWGRK